MSTYIKYLQIDSFNKASGTTHDFEIQIDPALLQVKGVELIGLNLPLTQYIINSTNNIIYFTDGLINFQALIPVGVYDTNSLPGAIKIAMEATGYGGIISVIFSQLTYKLTIDSTLPIQFQWATFSQNSASNILGFNNVNSVLALSHISDNTINLSIPPCIFISLDQFTSQCRSTKGNIHGTFAVYLTGNSGDISFHFDKTHFNIETSYSISQINRLHIRLINARNGQPFNINGMDWTMLLKLHY